MSVSATMKLAQLSERDRSAIGVMFTQSENKDWDEAELASACKKKLKLKTLQDLVDAKAKAGEPYEFSEQVNEFLLTDSQHAFITKKLDAWVNGGKTRCASSDQLIELRDHLKVAKDQEVAKKDEAKKDDPAK